MSPISPELQAEAAAPASVAPPQEAPGQGPSEEPAATPKAKKKWRRSVNTLKSRLVVANAFQQAEVSTMNSTLSESPFSGMAATSPEWQAGAGEAASQEPKLSSFWDP